VAPKRFILHVTSEEEAKGSLGIFSGIEAAIIPNGIEIPEKVSCVNANGVLRLLYVGRLHPIKGIENLLAACKMLDGSPTIPWSLTIVGGGDEGYTESLLCRTRELALSKQVQMIGEVVGEAKKGLFEHADIVIVPSHTENFGMVVAEALAHGVPVIASRGTPWRKLEEIGCGLWVDNDPESLAQAIHMMSKTPLREMGQRGRRWMEREFAWSRVAQDMSDLYNRLLVNVS
jgi:glycosyltransferase involved in cell wall biosynthesis